eukprot:UN0163
MLSAADVLTLAGTTQRLNFLAHDMVRREEEILNMRFPASNGRIRLNCRIEERIRTLIRGSTYLDEVTVSYKGRGSLMEDLHMIRQQGDAFICGDVPHAGQMGAKPGWFVEVQHAYSSDDGLREQIDCVLAQSDALSRLTEEHFWQGKGMVVLLRFSMFHPAAHLRVDDMSSAKQTIDLISSLFPRKYKIRGGSGQEPFDDPMFCDFYAMPSNDVKAFATRLMQQQSSGRAQEDKTLKQLQALAQRAAFEGQCLFMEHTVI